MKAFVKSILVKIKNFMLNSLTQQVWQSRRLLETNTLLLAGLHVERVKKLNEINNLKEAEFKVFSSGGQDGITQFLINKIHIESEVFVEFGVEDYTESNSRFLLINDNWSGLIIDCEQRFIDYITNDPIYWQRDLTAVCQLITRENISDIIINSGISGDIGLLSIDIDGNDYWVWEAINVVNPRIVVCEYNSLLGAKHSITIPYDPKFDRTRAHYSHLYYGASLPALCRLADAKGYNLVGTTSIGSNAFFVRKDLGRPFKKLTPEEGYVESKVRESRGRNGQLNYVSGKDRRIIIEDMEVYDLDLECIRRLKNVWKD